MHEHVEAPNIKTSTTATNSVAGKQSGVTEGFALANNPRAPILQRMQKGDHEGAEKKRQELMEVGRNEATEEDREKARQRVEDVEAEHYDTGWKAFKELPKGDDSTLKGYGTRVHNDAVNDRRRQAAEEKGSGGSKASAVVKAGHAYRTSKARPALIEKLASGYAKARFDENLKHNQRIQAEAIQLKDKTTR